MNYQSCKKHGIKNPISLRSTSTDLEDSDALHFLELSVGRGGFIGVIRSCLEFLHGIEIWGRCMLSYINVTKVSF